MIIERMVIPNKKTATVSKVKIPSLLLCRHKGKTETVQRAIKKQ